MIANSINVGLPVSSETIYLLNSFVSFLLLPILPKYALWESSGRSQRQVNFFQDLWLGFSNQKNFQKTWWTTKTQRVIKEFSVLFGIYMLRPVNERVLDRWDLRKLSAKVSHHSSGLYWLLACLASHQWRLSNVYEFLGNYLLCGGKFSVSSMCESHEQYPYSVFALLYQIIMVVHLWLRSEPKANERRSALSPEKCKDLLSAGKMTRSF